MNPINNLPYFLILIVAGLIIYSVFFNTNSVQTTASGIEINYLKTRWTWLYEDWSTSNDFIRG